MVILFLTIFSTKSRHLLSEIAMFTFVKLLLSTKAFWVMSIISNGE